MDSYYYDTTSNGKTIRTYLATRVVKETVRIDAGATDADRAAAASAARTFSDAVERRPDPAAAGANAAATPPGLDPEVVYKRRRQEMAAANAARVDS